MMKCVAVFLLMSGPAFAGYSLTVTMETMHGEIVTLVATSDNPEFCKKWKSDSKANTFNDVALTAKRYRKAFAIGPDALGRVWGSATIISETCAGH